MTMGFFFLIKLQYNKTQDEVFVDALVALLFETPCKHVTAIFFYIITVRLGGLINKALFTNNFLNNTYVKRSLHSWTPEGCTVSGVYEPFLKRTIYINLYLNI